MRGHRIVLAVVAALAVNAVAAAAEDPPPSLQVIAAHAAQRFPQPVAVGTLIGRDVLKPTEAQSVLGHVAAITRRNDGGLDAIIAEGGLFGLGARHVAVPVEAIALLGEHVALMDLTPAQLRALPAAADAPGLAAGEVIQVGLTRPFH